MGTTKLTRKEILSEDPVHQALVDIVEFFRTKGKLVAIGAGAVLVVVALIYIGVQYLGARNLQAQQEFSRGLDLYHGRIDPAAQDDPYAKGPEPTFKDVTARNQAAEKVFASVNSRYGFSKLAPLARYYQGLCQMNLGRKDDAIKSLESIRNNTKDRTVGYLARKVLAQIYLDSGNPKGAQEVLESMVSDPQCELPAESIKLQLAQVYSAEGKRDQAVKLLREARDQAQAGRSMLAGSITQELTRLEGGSPAGAPAAPVQQIPAQLPISPR